MIRRLQIVALLGGERGYAGRVGSVLNRNRSWLATLTVGDLNRYSRSRSTIAANKTRYREAEISHRLPAFFGGQFELGVGYEYREDMVLDNTDHGVRVFAGWSFRY